MVLGPVSVQVPIKAVSEAWLEQRDPLGLTSVVPATVGCSSPSPPGLNVSSTQGFVLRVRAAKTCIMCGGAASRDRCH